MPEGQNIVENLAEVTAAFKVMREVLKLTWDVNANLGEGRQNVQLALEEADRQLEIAEATFAKSLGYPLCRCQFPPTIMLKIGYTRAPNPRNPDIDVHQCPKCGSKDCGGRKFSQTVNLVSNATGEELPG